MVTNGYNANLQVGHSGGHLAAWWGGWSLVKSHGFRWLQRQLKRIRLTNSKVYQVVVNQPPTNLNLKALTNRNFNLNLSQPPTNQAAPSNAGIAEAARRLRGAGAAAVAPWVPRQPYTTAAVRRLVSQLMVEGGLPKP